MATRVSSREILRMRLRAQLIEITSQTGVVAATRHLLALQAQDFTQALWAIGLRAEGSRRKDVLAALDRGEIVRSLPIRGTLHFVAADDLRWMLSLTAARTLASTTTHQRALGLDQPMLDRAADIVGAALAGGGRLGRSEFMALLESNGIPTSGERGYYIIFVLCQRGLICWGPPSGTAQALVLVDEWIPGSNTLARDEALRELALRYFAGHGPATTRDFAWWAKLTLTDARAAVSSAADELTEVTLDEVSYWIATRQVDAAAVSRRSSFVHALPGFDEYLLGYQDRSLPLAAEYANRIVPGGNGIFLPLIVADGGVAGTWRRAPKSATPEADYFSAATAAQRAGFARAAAAYAAFMAD